jgi:hypothetical protein
MKRITTICNIILLIFYSNAFAQKTESHFIDAEFASCVMIENISFAFSTDGKISVYDRHMDKGNYFFSSTDNGKSWKKTSTVDLALKSSLLMHCWGYNQLEYDAAGDLNLVMKYKPIYDNSKMNYLLFKSRDAGTNWTSQQSFVNQVSLKWDNNSGNSVSDNEMEWYSQKTGPDRTVMASIASVGHGPKGKVFISNSTDNGKTWVKNPVTVNGNPVTEFNLRGMKFFSDQLGLLFLTDKYLLTSDGGKSWEEYAYPNNAKVHSADASDPQHIYISKGNDIGMFSVKSSALENIYISNSEQVVKMQLKGNILHCITSGGYYMKFSTDKFNEQAGNMNISVFPNPVISQVTFSAYDLTGKTVSIINLEGKTVAQKQGSGTSVTFDVQNLPTGIYFTEVQTPGEKPVSIKWIKNRTQ